MEVKAQAKFIRIAPRKTRLVVGLVRGMGIERARQQLLFSKKMAAKPVLKLLNSAVANATNNFHLDPTDLVIAQAFVDEGPKIHRFTPKAQGRATPIRLRMSHITIVVAPKVAKATKDKAVVTNVTEEKPSKTKLAVKKAPRAKKIQA